MQVYILDRAGTSVQEMLGWLSENPVVNDIEKFDSYDEFLAKVETQKPDICFIRLGYAEIPGMKAADKVKALDADIKIVFFSDERDYALDAFEIGGNGYLLCPVKKKKLEQWLARVQKFNSS